MGAGIYNRGGRVTATGSLVDAILSLTTWAGGAVTYGFPQGLHEYQPGYGSALDRDRDGLTLDREGFWPLSVAQQAAVAWALDAETGGAFSVEGFTGLEVTRLEDGGQATLRVAGADDHPIGFIADWAGAPLRGDEAYAGDVFLGWATKDQPLHAGSHHRMTILHELGHALGLKHPHEGGGFNFEAVLPVGYDGVEFTVMSYKSGIGRPNGYNSLEAPIYPQTFMQLDIAALQHLFGADFEANAGDSVYRWDEAGRSFVDGALALDPEPGSDRIFQTIWDGGGTDLYDLSNFANDMRIDLGPGRASVFAPDQRVFLDGATNDGWAWGNVYNALLHKDDPRSLVENALSGAGDDRLRGNDARNRLEGGDGDDLLAGMAGADLLLGRGGDDRLIGGAGGDRLLGGAGDDVFAFFAPAHSTPLAPDLINDFEGAGGNGGDVIDLSGFAAFLGLEAFRFGRAGPGGVTVAAGEDEAVLEIHARSGPEPDLLLRIRASAGASLDLDARDFYGVA